MTEILKYNISFIESLAWNNTFDNYIPQEILDKISKLSETVGSPSYIKTPTFNKSYGKNDHNKRDNGSKYKNNGNINNETIFLKGNIPFKKTVFVKKDGLDKEIDTIRALLNKISEKNYDTIKESIHEKMTSIVDFIRNEKEESSTETTKEESSTDTDTTKEESSTDTDTTKEESSTDTDTTKEESSTDTEKEIKRLGNTIFNIATTNKFNSRVYAKLCKYLIGEFKFMNEIFLNSLHEYMNLFDTIEYVSPNIDYDKFCELNIVNEKRKAMSMFLTNLMIEDVVSIDKISEIIIQLHEKIITYLDIEDKSNNIEELTENNYIFITCGYWQLKKHDKWETILNNITYLSKMKKNMHPSISHKAIFKNMDIIDFTKKNT
jgi:hypothetical protein